MAFGEGGNGNIDVLGQGIFETSGSAFHLFEGQDTNVDNLVVGNDRAYSTGWAGIFPWDNNGPAIATNNLEIKKNQDSGECECCKAYDNVSPCRDCCIKVNVDQINIGNRFAEAFGLARATNNKKIVANQQ